VVAAVEVVEDVVGIASLVVEVVDTVIKDIRAVIYITGVHIFKNTFILVTKSLIKLLIKTNTKFSTYELFSEYQSL